MPRKYQPTTLTIDNLLGWIKSGDIAIPEIQRPFVWDATSVRNLIDSLYNDYPIGYLIIWKSSDVNLKDGERSIGKKILIDGQQRITALMAALIGLKVVTKDYRKRNIRIAFNPQSDEFEVTNPAISKSSAWIPDISLVFDPEMKRRRFVDDYCERNAGVDPDVIDDKIRDLLAIVTNPIGIIELDSSLDIETVTEIFIRVNLEGTPLSQADFAMSKIAVNELYDGVNLRKAVDYFCHLAVAPQDYDIISNDEEFASTEYFRQMSWLRHENDDLYDPTYADMLRVAFTSEFRRGRLQDLVALLSGRNFETREYEDHIMEETFSRLSRSVMDFMNQTHFNRFVMIIRSTGFIDSSMIRSQNALNFAYILYLTLRKQGVDSAAIEQYVRRWYVMSILTGRYSGSSETTIDLDIRNIHELGIDDYLNTIIESQLSEAFWNGELIQRLGTSVSSSPYWHVFRAAQVALNDRGFLSSHIHVRELIEHRSDVHHIFPRALLKSAGMTRKQYNQIANYVITQSEINIAIGKKSPHVYMQDVIAQTSGTQKKYGNITELSDLQKNLEENCIPHNISTMTIDDYDNFLVARRRLMAQKIKTYFLRL
jgi:hypothetical protein